MSESHNILVNRRQYIDENVDGILSSDLFFHATTGSKKEIRTDLSKYEISVLEKVKRLMNAIRHIIPGIKAVFSSKEYAAFLEGTLNQYNGINLFGCNSSSEIVTSNLPRQLKTYFGDEISSVRHITACKNSGSVTTKYPKFVFDVFEVEYPDGTFLTYQYIEVYSLEFSVDSNWLNMFTSFSFGFVCSVSSVGLLLIKNEVVLYRQQGVKQRELCFHEVRGFGNPFGLGYLCYNNLPC